MAVILGSGDYRYRVDESWGTLPDGWSLGDAAGVAVDRHDRVYVFNRGAHPMVVFDREGNFLSSWGEGVFNNPHGLHYGADDYLYCTDDGDHTVRKCRLDGKIELTIGLPGEAAPRLSGKPFCRCTHSALSPKGEIYVSDGYGNARVHKYSPDGKLLTSWGRPGTDPGCFNIVHNICCDGDDWIYVADRENHRVQVFNGQGKFEAQWNNLHRPCGLFMSPGREQLCYVGELGPFMAVNRDWPDIGPRISVVSHKGELVARFGDNGTGRRPDQFIAPHGLAVDSRGDVYVGEVANTAWPQMHAGEPPPKGLRVLRKLVRVGADAT